MTQGERIKYIRQCRGLTQQQLGELCGFSEQTAGVRIRQYESNKKSPKKDTLMLIAHALKINYVAIRNYDLGCAEDILETLFWLDTRDILDIFPLAYELDTSSDWVYKGQYNDPECTLRTFPPYGIVVNYYLVNDFMEEWYRRKVQFDKGEITKEQYNNWKWNWPYSCDAESGDTYVDWMNL